MTEIGINVGGAAKREIGFRPGPLFFEQDGVVMFQIGLDASSIIGPNPMKTKDRHEYLEAWFRFCDNNPEWDVGTGDRKASASWATIQSPPITIKILTEVTHYGPPAPAEASPEVAINTERDVIRAELAALGAPMPHPRTGLSKLREALAEARAAA